jgi:hypothetical protein
MILFDLLKTASVIACSIFKGCVTKIYWYNSRLLKLHKLQARSSAG